MKVYNTEVRVNKKSLIIRKVIYKDNVKKKVKSEHKKYGSKK